MSILVEEGLHPNGMDLVVQGKLPVTKESLSRAIEQFFIKEAKRVDRRGLIVGPSVERLRATRDLCDHLDKHFGLCPPDNPFAGNRVRG